MVEHVKRSEKDSLLCFFEQGLSLNQELGWQPAIPHSSVLYCWVIARCPCLAFHMRAWGLKPGSSCLLRRHSYPLSYFSSFMDFVLASSLLAALLVFPIVAAVTFFLSHLLLGISCILYLSSQCLGSSILSRFTFYLCMKYCRVLMGGP